MLVVQFEEVSQSTFSPIAQEVAHRELQALITQNSISSGYMVEEVRDCKCGQKLVTTGAR
jgi:hypothetical protein